MAMAGFCLRVTSEWALYFSGGVPFQKQMKQLAHLAQLAQQIHTRR